MFATHVGMSSRQESEHGDWNEYFAGGVQLFAVECMAAMTAYSSERAFDFLSFGTIVKTVTPNWAEDSLQQPLERHPRPCAQQVIIISIAFK